VHRRDIDAAPDAALHERLGVRDVRAVLVVHVRLARRRPRDGDAGHVAEQVVEHARVPPRPLDEFGQALETGESHGGLHVGEPPAVLFGQRVEPADALPESLFGFRVDERRGVPNREEGVREHLRPDERVLPLAGREDAFDALFSRPRFGVGQCADALRQIRVPHPCEPAAVRVERLERLETEEACVAQRADHAVLVGRTERMRTVFDDFQLVSLRDLENRIHVAGQAVEVGRQDGACLRRDGALHRSRTQRERDRIDVREHGRETGDARDLRHDPERQRGDDDLGSRREVHRFENEIERHPSVLGGAHPDVARSEDSRELLFECFDERTLNELFACAAVPNDVLQLGNDAGAKPCDCGHDVDLSF